MLSSARIPPAQTRFVHSGARTRRIRSMRRPNVMRSNSEGDTLDRPRTDNVIVLSYCMAITQTRSRVHRLNCPVLGIPRTAIEDVFRESSNCGVSGTTLFMICPEELA